VRIERGLETEEVPRFYDSSELRPAFARGGWIVAAGAIAVGVWAMVGGAGSWLADTGAVLAALGVIVVVGLIRFRRCEIIVGRRWATLQVGPVRHRLGSGQLAGADVRPARRWRRLYADRELQLDLAAHGRILRFPVCDSESLVRELHHPGDEREVRR